MAKQADLKRLGVLFSVFDGDAKHFDRFQAELERLGFPFAVNLDHCCAETKQRFGKHRLCVGSYEDDDPESFFDESHRQRALTILQEQGFAWVLQMDVDETLERNALAKIDAILTMKVEDKQTLSRGKVQPDLVDCRVLDLWGDASHYRVDGTFAQSHREKFFRMSAGSWAYYHPTIHSPKLRNTTPKDRPAVVVRNHELYVLHWGIMDMADVREHTERWDTIYTRKVGGNPYGFYPYINDPNTVIALREVPDGVL